MIRSPLFYALGLAIGLSLGMALISAGMRQGSQVFAHSVVSQF